MAITTKNLRLRQLGSILNHKLLWLWSLKLSLWFHSIKGKMDESSQGQWFCCYKGVYQKGQVLTICWLNLEDDGVLITKWQT